MKHRVAAISASTLSIPAIQLAFAERWPEASVMNLVDDTLYSDLKQAGSITPSIRQRVADLIGYAVTSGASGVIFTASAFGPAVENAARSVSIPVLATNEALVGAGLRQGTTLGIVCSVELALKAFGAEICAAADRAKLSVSIHGIEATGALEAAERGDYSAHDGIIVDAVKKLPAVDAVLLGQFTMARAAPAVMKAVNVPVLTSPSTAVDHLKAVCAANSKG